MKSWADLPDEDDEWPVAPPCIEVEITEPEVVGTILGPNGEPLHSVLDRSTVAFGFQR